jgi:hypothetical protein
MVVICGPQPFAVLKKGRKKSRSPPRPYPYMGQAQFASKTFKKQGFLTQKLGMEEGAFPAFQAGIEGENLQNGRKPHFSHSGLSFLQSSAPSDWPIPTRIVSINIGGM